MFPCEFYEISKNTFFYRTLSVVAFRFIRYSIILFFMFKFSILSNKHYRLFFKNKFQQKQLISESAIINTFNE